MQAPAAVPAAAGASSFGTVTDAERIRKLATDTVKKNDKNSNGILEGDELDNLRMSRGADTNGDGKITYDELVAFYSPKPSTTNSPRPAAQPQPDSHETTTATSNGKDQRKLVNTSRKSYRFKSTKDRLSSWRFSSRDSNGDGQVSMHEYASSWNDRTAAEFQRYDHNNDGMITPDEAK